MKFLLPLPFLAASLMAQTFVDGRVIDSLTGAPVSGAYISVSQNLAGNPMPVTDSAGHFRLESHDNQIYLTVHHNGYLYRNQTIALEPGQAPPEVRVLLVPQAAISGHVFDENGLPVSGARVSALQYREVNGQRQLRQWRGDTETNEFGEYRIFELPAGRYYLSVTPGKLAEWDPRYSTRLYPDAVDAERAEPVDVRAGEERGGRDIRLTPQEGVTIAGRLARTVAGHVSLYFRSAEYSDYSIPVTQQGDSFTVAHVPPGNYTLRTWSDSWGPKTGELTGDMTLQVGTADMRDIRLEIRAAEEQDLSGTVVFLGRTKPGPMEVTLRREPGEPKTVVSNADGSFVVKGLLPGRYLLDIRNAPVDGAPAPDRWFASAQLGPRDVSQQWFDLGTAPPGELKISMASPVAKLTGKLLDAAGSPVSGATILFQSSADKLRSYGRTAKDGAFTASFRESGEYRVFAVSGADELLNDADFLRSHEGDFPPIRVAEGANAPVVLRLK
jgi:protocatechuate 3,4-dioxygenase beta subunit